MSMDREVDNRAVEPKHKPINSSTTNLEITSKEGCVTNKFQLNQKVFIAGRLDAKEYDSLVVFEGVIAGMRYNSGSNAGIEYSIEYTYPKHKVGSMLGEDRLYASRREVVASMVGLFIKNAGSLLDTVDDPEVMASKMELLDWLIKARDKGVAV